MSQDDSANSARIPISLFTISAILLAAANRTTLNDEIQTRHFTARGAQSSANPNVSATSPTATSPAATSPAAGFLTSPNAPVRETKNSKLNIIPATDILKTIEFKTIESVIDQSDTFDNLQQNLREYGINITSKIISINIA